MHVLPCARLDHFNRVQATSRETVHRHFAHQQSRLHCGAHPEDRLQTALQLTLKIALRLTTRCLLLLLLMPLRRVCVFFRLFTNVCRQHLLQCLHGTTHADEPCKQCGAGSADAAGPFALLTCNCRARASSASMILDVVSAERCCE